MTGIARYVACRFCRRPLTDPESRALGYGPDCAAERGLPHGAARRPQTAGAGQEELDLTAQLTDREGQC